MKFLENLIKKTNTFQRIVGLPLEKFKILANWLENGWMKKDVSTDVMEQQCYRSENYETQKHYYLGKKRSIQSKLK